MAKGLRSNKKKALRTIRRYFVSAGQSKVLCYLDHISARREWQYASILCRNDVSTSEKYLEAEAKRLASQQLTAEAGKQARELVSIMYVAYSCPALVAS